MNEQVMSKADLEKQRTQLVLQRSQAKDQIEQIEKALQVVNAMISVHTSYEKDTSVTD